MSASQHSRFTMSPILIDRRAHALLKALSASYPVLAITGPRQSGKTTLAKMAFPEKTYVNLETPTNLDFARSDPVGFLQRYEAGAIIDEAQNCPALFSYLQEIVDRRQQMGQFVVTGSQQFGMVSKITQSLAGRVGLVELLPFTISELQHLEHSSDLQMLKGFYPPLYSRTIEPEYWAEDYVKTYIERDVRKIINIVDLSKFRTFLKLCAARTGQLINLSEIGDAAGVNLKTVKSWLSVLESSYVLYLLPPHHKNFTRRLVKSPKLYFYDTGIVCYLLGLTHAKDLQVSPFRGQIFETMIVSELAKCRLHGRDKMSLYFWRDNKGTEIDLLIERAGKLLPVEIKSGQTFHSSWLKNLSTYTHLAQESVENKALVYGGSEQYKRQGVEVFSWAGSSALLDLMY